MRRAQYVLRAVVVRLDVADDFGQSYRAQGLAVGQGLARTADDRVGAGQRDDVI